MKNEKGYAKLTDEQIEEIVKRSYQYVAMYNVNQKIEINWGYNGNQKYIFSAHLFPNLLQFIFPKSLYFFFLLTAGS